VNFRNGMVVREPIVDIDDTARRLVWSAIGGSPTHYNASPQVFADADGQTRLIGSPISFRTRQLAQLA